MTQGRYTPEQLDGFRASFARKQRRQIAIAIPIAGTAIAILAGRNQSTGTVFGTAAGAWGLVFLAVVAAALVFSMRNWRCPACDRYLGRSLGPHRCARCGVQLR